MLQMFPASHSYFMYIDKPTVVLIRGNTNDFNHHHPLPKDSVPAHGASHHAGAPGPTI